MEVVITSVAEEKESAGIQGVSRNLVVEKSAWQMIPDTEMVRIVRTVQTKAEGRKRTERTEVDEERGNESHSLSLPDNPRSV